MASRLRGACLRCLGAAVLVAVSICTGHACSVKPVMPSLFLLVGGRSGAAGASATWPAVDLTITHVAAADAHLPSTCPRSASKAAETRRVGGRTPSLVQLATSRVLRTVVREEEGAGGGSADVVPGTVAGNSSEVMPQAKDQGSGLQVGLAIGGRVTDAPPANHARSWKSFSSGWQKQLLLLEAHPLQIQSLQLVQRAKGGFALLCSNVGDRSSALWWLLLPLLLLSILVAVILVNAQTSCAECTSTPSVVGYPCKEEVNYVAATPQLGSSLPPDQGQYLHAPSASSIGPGHGGIGPVLCQVLVVPEGEECVIQFPVWAPTTPNPELIHVTDPQGGQVLRLIVNCDGNGSRGPASTVSLLEPKNMSLLPHLLPLEPGGTACWELLLQTLDGASLVRCQQTTPERFEFFTAEGEYYAMLTRGVSRFQSMLLAHTGLRLSFWGTEFSMTVTDAELRRLATANKEGGQHFRACFAPSTDVGMLICGFICTQVFAETA